MVRWRILTILRRSYSDVSWIIIRIRDNSWLPRRTSTYVQANCLFSFIKCLHLRTSYPFTCYIYEPYDHASSPANCYWFILPALTNYLQYMISKLITCLINFMVRVISYSQIPHRCRVIYPHSVRQLSLSLEDSPPVTSFIDISLFSSGDFIGESWKVLRFTDVFLGFPPPLNFPAICYLVQAFWWGSLAPKSQFSSAKWWVRFLNL